MNGKNNFFRRMNFKKIASQNSDRRDPEVRGRLLETGSDVEGGIASRGEPRTPEPLPRASFCAHFERLFGSGSYGSILFLPRCHHWGLRVTSFLLR